MRVSISGIFTALVFIGLISLATYDIYNHLHPQEQTVICPGVDCDVTFEESK
jgi:hypothetical protein